MKLGKRQLLVVTLIVLSILGIGGVAAAATKTMNASASRYELEDGSQFDVGGQKTVSTFSYGANSIGNLTIFGDITSSSKGNVTAYGSTNALTIGYTYDGGYQTKTKEDWNLTDSGLKTINSIDIDKKISLGAIIIQTSADGQTWETQYTVTDYFSKNKEGNDNLYTISNEDLKDGTYYRVYVAYRMRHKTGVKENFFIIPDEDIYEYKEFVEEYAFYTYYNGNPVTLWDIDTHEEASGSVTNGFIVDKGNTDFSVAVKKDNGASVYAQDLASFTAPGKYELTVTDDLSQSYKMSITVSNGTKLTSLSPEIYEGGKSGKYEISGDPVDEPSFSSTAVSILKIGQDYNSRVTISKKNGISAYGISGDSLNLYLNLSNATKLEPNGWEINTEDYGKKKNETVNGTQTGRIASGALVIQKSTDGGNTWENVEQGRYANGLYTTDFYSYYGDKGDVFIYSPDGDEILNGLYLKVLYAYELKATDSKSTNRIVEVYSFYLCSDDLGAVTFHNLSVDDDVIKQNIGSDNIGNFEIYKKAETLLSGSSTVSGFSIDISENPTVTYSVKRNGTSVSIPDNNQFITTGKYEISLKSAVGNTDTVIIYVDRNSADTSLKNYFSDGFITSDSKRIFGEGDYPIFEGGKTTYCIDSVDENELPLSGTITNTSTGTTITILGTRSEKTGIIKEPGIYEATLTTAQQSDGTYLPGDYLTFTFHFEIIAEGSAPGPVVNENSLSEYAKSSMIDAYPMYYGLTFNSASKGNITLAFATKEAAVKYAYDYEKGTVEIQEDGSYRYADAFVGKQKDRYNSIWDLADDLNEYAEQAVQEGYFDMSDQYTYLTLDDSVIENTDNLRTLELEHSVVIFAESEKEKFCEKADSLPIISVKKFAKLTPGKGGAIQTGQDDFKFVSDKYGCDSNEVVVTDFNGKEYKIQYNKGVGEQLQNAGCPSGIVTITESTIYGDTNSYKAIFIADGENTGSVEVTYYIAGREMTTTVSADNSGTVIKADAFNVSGATDELDAYSIIKVEDASDSTRTYVYAADQSSTGAWSKSGEYTVSLVNRLGYSLSVTVDITESGYAALSFNGDGTEYSDSIIVEKEATNIELPTLTRLGYTLVGYKDQDDNEYELTISEIDFTGERILEPIWEAKHFSIFLQDESGSEIQTIDAEFGKTYGLSDPEIPEGYTFVGWKKDGELLEVKEYTVSEEADVILVASVINDEGDAVSNIPQKTIDKKTSTGNVVIIIVVIIGLCVIVAKKRKKILQASKEVAGTIKEKTTELQEAKDDNKEGEVIDEEKDE